MHSERALTHSDQLPCVPRVLAGAIDGDRERRPVRDPGMPWVMQLRNTVLRMGKNRAMVLFLARGCHEKHKIATVLCLRKVEHELFVFLKRAVSGG